MAEGVYRWPPGERERDRLAEAKYESVWDVALALGKVLSYDWAPNDNTGQRSRKAMPGEFAEHASVHVKGNVIEVRAKDDFAHDWLSKQIDDATTFAGYSVRLAPF